MKTITSNENVSFCRENKVVTFNWVGKFSLIQSRLNHLIERTFPIREFNNFIFFIKLKIEKKSEIILLLLVRLCCYQTKTGVFWFHIFCGWNLFFVFSQVFVFSSFCTSRPSSPLIFVMLCFYPLFRGRYFGKVITFYLNLSLS